MSIEITPTALEGVLIITPKVFGDERGFFQETYHADKFAELGLPTNFVQDNHSRSKRGVVRGLHYQDMRAPMAKLVRCTAGRLLDIAVDLRVGSPTFGKWVGVELAEDNHRQLLVPVGFGHGFVVLSEYADLQYRCTNFYAPETEGAVLWNDPAIGVDWNVEEPILSARDQQAQTLAEYLKNPAFYYEKSRPISQ